jgi:hypothetical protein
MSSKRDWDALFRELGPQIMVLVEELSGSGRVEFFNIYESLGEQERRSLREQLLREFQIRKGEPLQEKVSTPPERG